MNLCTEPYTVVYRVTVTVTLYGESGVQEPVFGCCVDVLFERCVQLSNGEENKTSNTLKGLPHEMDLDFEDMHGQF